MMKLMKTIYWLCFCLIGYVYFIYPLLIWVISKVFDKKFVKNRIEPSVSIIITAYNEEKNIARKIENTLGLDYPREKLEIIIGSDGSSDRTNEIVKSYENYNVHLLAFSNNRGKTMVQNDCVRRASNDIIIFMDAASLCENDCIKKMVSNFADERVGAVAGRIEFVQSMDNLTTKSQGLYWKYEQIIKRAENRLGSLVGVDGPLYAVRKDLYMELEPEIISDLITPLLVIHHGHSVVYEPDAIAYEEATKRTIEEYRTRSRIVTRGFTGLLQYPELFSFVKHPLLTWQILSHKILRWLVGFFYVITIFCSLFLIFQVFYLFMLCCTSIFLWLAYYGFKTQDNPRLIYIVPYYFVLVNWAAIRGTIDFIMGKRIVSWKPVRE